MKNNYICPSCKKEFEWDDALDETMINCPLCRVQMIAPGPSLAKGSTVGDYEIKQRIGIGGMGEVYLAEQKSMKRPVALKILQEDLVKDKAYLERFCREVRTLAQIEHPNVVRAIEAGYDGKVCFFSMTFIDGKDIKRLLDEGHVFSEYDALKITCDISRALKYVWEKHGILHRDIKPANIMITSENDVKLMDLGISKHVKGEDVELTMTGMMVGSPQYISPEQAKALKDVDFRADMYSLGASFYHMLAGEAPYSGDNAMTIIASHLSDPIPDPRSKRPEISGETSRLISKMMAKKKENRFSSWDECIEEMELMLEALSLPASEKGADAEKKFPRERIASEKKEIFPFRLPPGKFVIFNKPYKFALFAFLFAISLTGMGLMIKKSILDAKKERARKAYDEAVKFGNENPEPANFRKTVSLFENVVRLRDPYYSQAAKTEIGNILGKAADIKVKRHSQARKNALNELKNKIYEYERTGDFDKAFSFLEDYRKSGPFAKEFEPEIAKSVDYLNRQKKVKEEGLE